MEPNKATICIVSPSLKMGGIERALTVLANYFATKGHAVHFISAQGGERFYKLDQAVRLHEFDRKRMDGPHGKILFYFQMVRFIRRTVLGLRPDVVLSFGDAFNPLVLLALKGTGIPVFISDRTSPDFKFNPLIKLGKKRLYPASAGFIAQTQRAADYKARQFGNQLNIRIIPNAIKAVEVMDVPKKNYITSVGRLSYEKGQDRLVKAFAQIPDKEGWELVFAGTGPLQQSLEELAKSLHIEKQVKFLGKITDVDRLLSETAVFVLPSRLEGFPNALCEAMSAGLPCVCFDSIPTEAFIRNGENGIVVPEGDIEGLARELSGLMQSPQKREYLGQNALNIRDQLSTKSNGDQFLEFLLNQ